MGVGVTTPHWGRKREREREIEGRGEKEREREDKVNREGLVQKDQMTSEKEGEQDGANSCSEWPETLERAAHANSLNALDHLMI